MRNTLATAAVLGALAAAPYAHAADPCKLEISGNDLMQFDKPQLSAPATCKEITVTLQHTGKLPREAMGHNWVLVNAADLAAVATAGMGAGLANNYVAPDDKRVLAHTKTIGGGETTSVTFRTSILKKGGAYEYLCTFPGHNALMHGVFKFG
ncbi:MAG: azurin [Gammaproteobacteria bacterium]|nr:MAG: azurin [Gammaproteobacteria bacterium]TLY84520.1 MAG: azurin [Gammaproteobacteria bacterium]